MTYALLNETYDVSDYVEGYEDLYKGTYRAVIVEPRRHRVLEKVLVNISEKLGCPITGFPGRRECARDRVGSSFEQNFIVLS